MTARTPPARRRPWPALALLVAATAGCGLTGKHEARKIPHPGIIDLGQPRELNMVSMPPYVVEPPDELEIAARPAALDLQLPLTLVVQPDGVINLGFYGEVYVAGLTIDQVEQKIANHLAIEASRRGIAIPPTEPIEVTARLVNGTQSKYYYVLGVVNTQGRFPITGNETVLDAILSAGLRSNSLPEKSYLARPHPAGGPCQVLRIEWDAIKCGDTTTNYQVLPGDRIVVPGTSNPGLLSSLLGGG